MKKLSILFILAFLSLNIHCGGGGGSASFTSGKTKVTINLGETRTGAGGLFVKASSTIPTNVTSIRFSITAPDMAEISETVQVAGQSTVSKQFDVPNGPNRNFVVEAINDALSPPDNVTYRGETYANLDGNPVALFIVMVSTDSVPPAFGGLVSATATSTTSVELVWAPASDNVTPQANIQYLIYMATSSGAQNFSAPSFVTPQGATSLTVIGLNPSTTYYFVVRAKDERGLIDTNVTEKSATTLSPPDTTPPSFNGLVSATAISSSEILLEWDPASDNASDPAHIDYLIYVATSSGEQNLAVANSASAPGATSFTVTGLGPDTTYYFIVRARDAAYNIDSNTVEKSATTKSMPDTTPPSFSGLVSATALSTSSIRLSWNPATDDVTPASDIAYYIYMSAFSKGQNFTIPRDIVLSAATATVTSLSPATTYYFVVRAADNTGNMEQNTVEKSATTLTPSFVDLQPVNAIINSFDISFDVVNNGTANAVNAVVFVESTDACVFYDCNSAMVSVPAGGSQNVVITLSYMPIEYRITVDPDNNIAESNESNNCISNITNWCGSSPPASCSTGGI
ncbi:MAG: fibronectin type III domain-containing protein [Nitrospirota bacterium]